MGHSILHLLPNKEQAIAKVHSMLKSGGVFVTSTVCVADTLKFWSFATIFFRVIAPIGRFVHLLPLIKIFSSQDLVDSLTDAGFTIDHQWTPGKGKSAFLVAKKAE